MKPCYSLLFAAAFLAPSLVQAQTPPVVVVEEEVVVTPPGQVVAEETVTETTTDGVVTETVVETGVTPRRVDPALMRRQLSIAPKPAIVPAPGSVVETTETTTVEQVPGMPPRVYNVERSVVIVEGRELPYVTVPVLFVKETDELLDADSRMAIEDTAAAIRDITSKEPTAKFDIEGHTSTDGADEMNMELSAKRARRVHSELTMNYKIPAEVLTAHGYGENFPKYPSGSEEQMTLDRRVLVVRVK